MQIIKKKFCLQSGTQMQIMKKVLSAIRNSNADNEKSTSAIRNATKKHDTLYSGLYVCPLAFKRNRRKQPFQPGKRLRSNSDPFRTHLIARPGLIIS